MSAYGEERDSFFAVSGTDILIPQNSLEIILRLLEGNIKVKDHPVEKTFFVCGRYRIPWNMVRQKPAVEEWDRYLLTNSWTIPKDELRAASFSLWKRQHYLNASVYLAQESGIA